MTNIELHALEVIVANLPKIAKACERMADAQEKRLELEKEIIIKLKTKRI